MRDKTARLPYEAKHETFLVKANVIIKKNNKAKGRNLLAHPSSIQLLL